MTRTEPYTIPEAARQLGFSRQHAWNLAVKSDPPLLEIVGEDRNALGARHYLVSAASVEAVRTELVALRTRGKRRLRKPLDGAPT